MRQRYSFVMAGHSGLIHFSGSAGDVAVHQVSSPEATVATTCPHCGAKTNAAVLVITKPTSDEPSALWMRCAGCHKAIVVNEDGMSPPPLPGDDVEGLPADVASAYLEARKALGVSAYTSCELICRKILMHIAVDKGANEGDTFAKYLDYLTNSGYITPPMKPWVDLIRQHGNSSTHRLAPASPERATNTLVFTAQLLRLVYEMEHKSLKFMPPIAL